MIYLHSFQGAHCFRRCVPRATLPLATGWFTNAPLGRIAYPTKLAILKSGQIWILTATAANPQEQTTREAICVPLALRWSTEFKTAPWAPAAGKVPRRVS